MAHEFKQAGDNRYVLQRGKKSILFNPTAEFGSVESARAAVKNDLARSREYKIAGIGILTVGALTLAAGVSSQFVHEIHGFTNPLYATPEIAKAGVDAYGIGFIGVGAVLASAGGEMKKDAMLISAAVDKFVEESQKTAGKSQI